MDTSNYIGIIADDLTGANDTSLQLFLRGCKTQVAFGEDISIDENLKTEVFAMSTETRNVDAKTAHEKVLNVSENILKKYNFEYIYKKIDSVLRGNIAVEVVTLLDSLEYDAAVIFPAFPNEGRTTIGGFHLVKGIPLQRTEVSRDPACPIMESNIINLLKSQLPEEMANYTDLISLDVVMKGAGPILTKLNDLISKGKKLIVADAVSTTDLEQIAFAVTKSSYKILPVGSAGAAQALGKIWHPDTDEDLVKEPQVPNLPKLVVSGSATDLTASQIKRLQENDNIENTYFIAIKPQNIFSNDFEEIAQRVLNNLIKDNTVIIHSSELIENTEELSSLLIENELTKEVFISKICDYLASVTKTVLSQKEAVLITVGGETSYKCCRAIGSKNLQIIDTVAPAIPLGVDHKGQLIVTKSGNLGTQNTLIDVVRYFEQDK
ncbi:TPA: four-carbon acid sugar kinase family protein [Candidatus Avigastranaerophilus faecigallinarum]|nr:four-carbon acid sugar kinase family protein [Candidatus Avigastranaerophilus faecigallinarum]